MQLIANRTNIRLDKYLNEELDLSRSAIKKMIDEHLITINNKPAKASLLVKEGDTIEVTFKEEEIVCEQEEMPLDIVYEDDFLAIINKPSGLVVHPAVGNPRHTLVNGLLYHFNKLSSKNTIRPGIVHRLDKDTSGLMIVAKDDKTHDILAKMIKNKEVERKYLALVWGNIRHQTGTIDAPIGRDINNRQKYTVTDINSKDSVTHFKVLERFKNATLIECKLDTGRTHQIRVHLNYIGYPVVNDPLYGNRKLINDFGQMLHSKSIKFIHPYSKKEIYFEKEPPQEFIDIVEKYRQEEL